MLTDLDIYLFDLRGYLVIENALTADEVAALNAGIDAILPLKHDEWYGYIHGHTYGDDEGLNLQQIYEGGEPFELVRHFGGLKLGFSKRKRPSCIELHRGVAICHRRRDFCGSSDI